MIGALLARGRPLQPPPSVTSARWTALNPASTHTAATVQSVAPLATTTTLHEHTPPLRSRTSLPPSSPIATPRAYTVSLRPPCHSPQSPWQSVSHSSQEKRALHQRASPHHLSVVGHEGLATLAAFVPLSTTTTTTTATTATTASTASSSAVSTELQSQQQPHPVSPQLSQSQSLKTLFDAGADISTVLNELRSLVAATGERPSAHSAAAILRACAERNVPETALRTHSMLCELGYQPDPRGLSALVFACGRAGYLASAFRAVNDYTKIGVRPNVVVYTTLMEACLYNGEPALAQETFTHFRQTIGEPDEAMYAVAIRACGAQEEVERALNLFEDMQLRSHHPTALSYRSLMWACANRPDTANQTYKYFLIATNTGLVPELHDFGLLMKAAAQLGDVHSATAVLAALRANSLAPSAHVLTSLFRTHASAALQLKSRSAYGRGAPVPVLLDYVAELRTKLEYNAPAAVALPDSASLLDMTEECYLQALELAGDQPLPRQTLNAYLSVYTSSLALKRAENIFSSSFAAHGVSPDNYSHGAMASMYLRVKRFEPALLHLNNIHPHPPYHLLTFAAYSFARRDALDLATEMLTNIQDAGYHAQLDHFRTLQSRAKQQGRRDIIAKLHRVCRL